MEAYIPLHRIWTPFPLMGKAGIGVLRNRSNQSPLPLSFPVVRTGDKGNKRVGHMGNTFWGGIRGPTRPRSFVISDL